ncbi:MAG: four helix bundle suffix domain-containing protein, partial [Patescibacteria group bacterium]|nr:four helix bundle suffix domain-containing protein [Patescibacteria group bacterium]
MANKKKEHPSNKHHTSDLIPPHGGYRKLKSYQTTEIICDGTAVFCEKFVPSYKRSEQMNGAARSGKQNIAEASQVSGTSKKSELKLINVARGSLEELLQDFLDYLRQNDLELWDKDSPQALAIRKLAYRKDKSYETYKTYLESDNPEVVANTLICLIHQANFLLDRQIKALENEFLEKGGFSERMYRKRTKHRKEQQKSDRKPKLRSLLLPFVLSVLSVLSFFPAAPEARAAAGVPKLLNFQGRLTDENDNLLDGTYYICFSIYDAESAGSKLWPAGDPSPTSVSVSNGVFSTQVGSADTLTLDFTDDTYYLNVYVNDSESCTTGGEDLTPRQQIASAGYAITASNLAGDGTNDVQIKNAGGDIDIDSATLTADFTSAFSIDGVGASNVTTDSGNLTLSTTTSGDILLDSAGNVGIGTTSPSQSLDLVGAMELEDTTTSTTGVVYKNGIRFIHNFQHPTGD